MLALLLLLAPQAAFTAEPDPYWTAVFDRTSGWTGADGIYSIPLSGGDRVGGWREHATAFVFSDTFIGEVDGNGQRQPGTTLINNSMAVQPAGAGPDPQRIRFLWDRSGGGDAAAFVPTTPSTLPGQFYWLKDGIRLGNQLHLFAARFSLDPPPFTRHGISLLSIDLVGLVPGSAPPTVSSSPRAACQGGTLPSARRIGISSGAVRGTRLSDVASPPLGASTMRGSASSGSATGNTNTRVYWDASRSVGASAPSAAKKLA